jgi:hypothetical protein
MHWKPCLCMKKFMLHCHTAKLAIRGVTPALFPLITEVITAAAAAGA